MGQRLFIPGTGGCFFATDGGERVGSILDLALDRQASFRCEHPADPNQLDPLRTTGLNDSNGAPVSIHAAGPIRAVYQPFFDATHPASTRKLYTFFAYDWRLDLRLSGQRLFDFLKARASRTRRFDVVCHSQGGLVLIWASLLAGPKLFPELVRRVVFMGVPMQGSVNAAAGLLEGVALVGDALVKAEPATVRSWPSVYQMLPRWALGIPGARGAELFKNSTWSAHGKLGKPGDPARGLDPLLLSRARAVKQVLDQHDFAPLRSIDRFTIVMGHDHPTRARMPQFPALAPEAKPDGDVIVRGDGLVPVDRTFELLPRALRGTATPLLTRVRSHMLMCSALAKFNQCESIFRA